MKEHEHTNKAETKLAPDDVAKDPGSDHPDEHKGHANHHAHMAADFRNRFWISLILTLPILILSPML